MLTTPDRDLRNVLCRGLAKLAEIQLAFFVAHNRTIEGQRVEVHVEPERAVGSLHKCERAYLRITDRAQG